MKQMKKMVDDIKFTLGTFEILLKNARGSVKRISPNNPELKSHWEGKVDAYQKIVLELQGIVK